MLRTVKLVALIVNNKYMNHHQSNADNNNYSANNQENQEDSQVDLREIKDLLQKNLVISQELKNMTNSVYKYVVWQRMIGAAKIALIILVIAAAFVYLPPLLQDLIAQLGAIYNQLLNLANNTPR